MRTKGALSADTLRIRDALKTFLSPGSPVSLRYCLYRLISMDVLESTKQYNKLLNVLRSARIDGTIDDECFVDNKRRTERSTTWTDLSEYRQWCVNFYRRNLWRDQPEHVEVWLEKDTTSFLVEPTTREWGVPLRVSTGFYSRPFLYEAAKDLSKIIKPIAIFYIGDFDPSGLAIEKAAQKGNGFDDSRRKEGLFDLLENPFEWSPEMFAGVTWTRLAVTESDFKQLPDSAKVAIKEDHEDTNGALVKGDVRAALFKQRYGGFGAEVEALEVVQEGLLAARVGHAIKQHIDQEQWELSVQQERQDRDSLEAA